MEATAPQHGLSNLQLELLKLYSRNIADENLLAIKGMIAAYFAKKTTELANNAWDEKGLDAETILKTHIRTPYR
jgi:hypothetical protein